VGAVPDREPAGLSGRVRRRVVSAAQMAAAAMAVVVLAGLVIVYQSMVVPAELRPTVGPGATGPPVLAPGDGIAPAVGPPLLQLALAAAAVIGLGVLAARATRRLVGYAAVVGIVAIVWIGSMIGTSDALDDGGGAFGVEPFRERPAGFAEGMFVDADGDIEFRIIVGLTNRSQLPLDLIGVAPVVPPAPDADRLARIVGFGYLPNEDCCLASHARPFERLRLEPGGFVQVVVLGRAGRCATSAVESGAMVIDSLPIVYEQLTLRHTAELPLSEPVDIVNDGVC
jgi:hypothetical protein